MNMKELSRLSDAELRNLSYQMMLRDNMNAASRIDEVRKFYHKTVTVVKGRKVPHGTTGECFWMGAYDNSKYGDPWGIYTTVRIGIRDSEGNIFWTSLQNVKLAEG